MKQATRIIRRIDDLGRIVIPKELRRQLKIQEGQPFEISTTKNGFVLNVYRPKISKTEIATEWLNHNQSLVSRYVPQFFIAGKSTCCIVLIQNKDFPFAFGKAKCAADDEYYEKIGKIISFCRAISRPELIPKEFFE